MFNLQENVILALNGLRSNKMRALLTMLGIIIGISSVIAIVTVGQTVTGSVTGVLNDMGANSVQVYVTARPNEDGSRRDTYYSDDDFITDEMLRDFKEAKGDAVAAWAVSSFLGSGKATQGRNEVSADVAGVNAEAIEVSKVDIVAGHFLNQREVENARRVAVISDRFVKDLFPGKTPQDILGREITVRIENETHTFGVVGVYHYEIKGMMQTFTGDVSTQMFIPITLAQQLQGGNTGYWGVQIKAGPSVVDSKAFASESADYFNQRFYRNNDRIMVKGESMESMIGQMTGVLTTISLAISIIAGISLLVGGIGVMNIMLVSVTERTREIGTRKALGATNAAIRVQFIVESIMICLVGGVIGVTLGTTLGYVGSSLMGMPGFPSIGVVAVAVGFSMAIGVFFGYYPANKAAKLDPIEALRYE